MTGITMITTGHWGRLRSAAVGFTLALAACTTASPTSTSTDNATTTALSEATQTATTTSGQLACTPDDAQISACDGKAANDACTLALRDGSDVAGTCLTTIDGTTLGCAPNPPAPPAAAVTACDSKAAGDACTLADHDGSTDTGVCAVARDGTTVACRHTFTPPQPAIDACTSKASGDTCTLTGRSGATLTGTCGLGPHGTSTVLACDPGGHFPDAAAACTGLAAGAACSLSSGREHSDGTCAADTSGTVVCMIECHTMGGPFDCDGAHHGPH